MEIFKNCLSSDVKQETRILVCTLKAVTEMQLELIQIISDQILDSIIANVKKTKFYAVAADEATDRPSNVADYHSKICR